MANLIVQVFDAPPSSSSTKQLETLRWNLWERPLAEQHTYQHYIQTAKRMKGSKYTVLVAKDGNRVIGMAEIGLNQHDEDEEEGGDDNCGSSDTAKILQTLPNDDQNDCASSSSSLPSSPLIDDSTIPATLAGTATTIPTTTLSPATTPNNATSLLLRRRRRRRPTIGVLCVDPRYRGKGVGNELVRRCERIVANVWNEPFLFAEVQPDNLRAFGFFQTAMGYKLEETTATATPKLVWVTVRRRRNEEKLQHYLLWKELEKDESFDMANAKWLLY